MPKASPILATPAVAALFVGERSRLEGPSDPVQWQAAATAWLAPGRPYPAAYAQWRQAEALRAAHAVAVRLGAAPLRRELELLAQRARIRLEPPGEPALAEPKAPSVAASVGLTGGRRRCWHWSPGPDQPADRSGAVHRPQDGQRPRLTDPRQAGGRRPRGSGRDRHRLGLDKP
jgi:hypothetical protein